jgi:two-component system CheB/CheR fusion protein
MAKPGRPGKPGKPSRKPSRPKATARRASREKPATKGSASPPEAAEATSAARTTPLPIVGMGASAGGLEAFQKFFSRMPHDTGMAFIVVQHLDPRHATLLPELLGKITRMSVEQVKDETPVEHDHVYVIPPNATLTIEGGVLRVQSPPGKELRNSIDALFHSLAEDQGYRAVCVLFSGTGTDGTLGLRSVKEHGGMAMAQSPESARHDSILRSAIGTGLVDHVLAPEQMPAKLVEYAAYLRELHRTRPDEIAFDPGGDQLARICALLRRKTGHDFSRYKSATLVRRIQRRMHVLQSASAAAYVERLRHEPKEVEALFRDLLIGVTHFFRDREAFSVLAKTVVPAILDHAGAEGSVRVWTPGCATGEEAFSVAILLREAMDKRDARPRVQIFAGDIDEEALEFARQARYPEGIAEHVSEERLERFFVRLGHSYQVVKEVREMCIFSTHNLIKDPPFSRLDLIVCRNLLIYLEGELQRHVARIFHYSLRPGGYLFLGPSESVVGPPDLFRTVDKKHRVFQRSDTVAVPALALPVPVADRLASRPPMRPWTARVAAAGQGEVVADLERVLIDEYAPAWVIVNADGESVYFSARTGRYLEPGVGTPSMDVVGMARQGLRIDLRTALHKAVKTREAVVHEGVVVETNGDVQTINLVVRPLGDLGHDPGLFLIVFQDLGPPRPREPGARDKARSPSGDQVVQQLESELRSTKEHLQATIEEVETSNEELKSSNEELLSTNEELQSANEELQTSKEELQSVNEELETINAELNKKVEELDHVNSDLYNLLQSTQIPTLFLDNQLRIKRFTHAATHLFHFIDADVGRPIGDLASRFEGDLMADLREVQRTLAVRERQVVLTDRSAVYLVRVLPYRRLDDVVDGLVVTFLDVTALNRALGERARLAGIVESSQDAIVGRSFDGTILTWNDAAERMFGYSANEALGSPMSLMVPPDGIAQVNEMHERVKLGESIPPFESVRLARDGRRIDVSVAISPIRDEAGHPVGASAIFRDISDLKRAQLALEQEAREKDQFLAILSHELRNPLAPIRTSLDLLRSGPGRQGADVALTIMDRQLSQLTSLVDQLLDAARMASGKIQLDLDDIDVVPLVAGVVQDHTRLIADAKLELKLSLPPPDAPLYVSADRLRLSQALSNLIGNAVKFTPREGTVTVGVYPDAAARSVTLSVRDTGIGIDAADKERLFRPFVQGDPKLRMHGGLGLGLALARSLVEAHGGRLDVRSEGAGRGAEFQISLPLLDGPRAHAARKRRPTEGSTRRRILIVEDNVDAAESLRQLLAAAGHEVETVADGATALERIRQLRPEIVLCDVRLPGEIDGLRLAKTVRGGDGGFGNPYLVAVTGFGRPEHREETRSAGFDRHLTKPASAEAIDRLLGELPPRR